MLTNNTDRLDKDTIEYYKKMLAEDEQKEHESNEVKQVILKNRNDSVWYLYHRLEQILQGRYSLEDIENANFEDVVNVWSTLNDSDSDGTRFDQSTISRLYHARDQLRTLVSSLRAIHYDILYLEEGESQHK